MLDALPLACYNVDVDFATPVATVTCLNGRVTRTTRLLFSPFCHTSASAVGNIYRIFDKNFRKIILNINRYTVSKLVYFVEKQQKLI